ncbi:12038_t:CDS:2, partial [Dentiscutata erythropus]
EQLQRHERQRQTCDQLNQDHQTLDSNWLFPFRETEQHNNSLQDMMDDYLVVINGNYPIRQINQVLLSDLGAGGKYRFKLRWTE